LGDEAELGSLTLAHPFRQRLWNTSVEKGAEVGSLTLAYPFSLALDERLRIEQNSAP
jgi:hypothetical protein